MPLLPVKIMPGLFLNSTPYAAKTRWTDGNCVRFRDGLPQQLGGWERLPGAQGIVGIPRAAITFRPNSQKGRYALVGTSKGAFDWDGGRLANVTPAGFPTDARENSLAGAGYGGGLYGRGLYGRPSQESGHELEAATWTFDHWGETIMAASTATETIYEYSAAGVMEPLENAPTARAVVTTDERHVIAIGARGNPQRAEWCDQENNTVWGATATNRAGGFNFQTAGRLQCGARGRGVTFIWSETDLFGLYPTFNQLSYSYERLGQNCGAVSPNAAVVVGEVAFWMGFDGFYAFNGQVMRLPSDLHDYVFGNRDNELAADFNHLQRAKVVVRHNSLFDEIWFMYPSAQSLENDRVVTYNYKNNSWSKADIPRAAWVDRGVFSYPIGITPAGQMLFHEKGHFADGGLIPSFIESAPFEIGNGDQIQHLKSFWPDAQLNTGQATITFRCRYYPNGDEFNVGPKPFNGRTERIMLTIAARQVALRIDSDLPGEHWEIGLPRFETQAGGLR